MKDSTEDITMYEGALLGEVSASMMTKIIQLTDFVQNKNYSEVCCSLQTLKQIIVQYYPYCKYKSFTEKNKKK